MVNNFKFITLNGLHYNANLHPDEPFFDDSSPDLELKIINSFERGVQWMHKASIISIIEKDTSIIGCPSIDMQYVIVTYSRSTKYIPPNNTVIYNADGSINRVLAPPPLVSKQAEKQLKDVESGMPSSLYFDMVKWRKDSQGDTVNAIRIVFAYEWFEERVLYPETGEFGECLLSGRL